jgi:hypothetical protein
VVTPRLLVTVAVDMNTDRNKDALSQFVDAATRRLWQLEFLDCLQLGLWIGASVLLVLGVVHVGLTAISPTVSLFVIAAVVAWMLIRTVSRKPEPTYAAVEIDRLFAAEALVATAVECLRQPSKSRSPASRVVIERANHAAHRWSNRLPETLLPRQRTAARIALAPLFVAALLLAQPGANVVDTTTLRVQTADSQFQRPAPQSDAGNLDTIAQLRRELADDKTSDAIAQLASAERLKDAAQNDGVEAEDGSQPTDESPPTNSSARAAATDNASGDDAGDGNSSEPSSEVQAIVQFDQTTPFAVPRTGQANAAATASDRQYGNTAIFSEYSSVRPLPAAPPESARDQSTLSAAEAAYAARYLSATGENNE